MQSYAEFRGKTTECTEKEIDALEEELREIDKDAVEINEDEEFWAFWAEAIDALYSDLEGE